MWKSAFDVAALQLYRFDIPAYRSSKRRRDAWAFSHNSGNGDWVSYSESDAEKIGSAMSATPDGGKVSLSPPFEVRWGSSATSKKMPTSPDTKIIQVNTRTGNTRVVRTDERPDLDSGIYETTDSAGVKRMHGFYLGYIDEKTRKITDRGPNGKSSEVDAVEIHVVPFYSARSVGLTSTMLRMWKIEIRYGKGISYPGGGTFSLKKKEDYASGSLETELHVLKTKLKDLLTHYQIEWNPQASDYNFMKNITTLG